MFGRKKTKLGMRLKPRTAEIISREYNEQSLHVGHKAMQIKEASDFIKNLETEIEEHIKVMQRARFEASQIPPKTDEKKGENDGKPDNPTG